MEKQVFTRYCARIPWLDDARVRPDKILPRWRCFDLKINWANLTRPSLVFFSSNTKPGSIFSKQNAEILRWISRNRESYGPWMRYGARCCSPPWDCNSTASPAQLRARIQRGEIPRKFNQSQCEWKYQEIRTTYTRRWAPRGKPRSAFRYLPLQPPDQRNRKKKPEDEYTAALKRGKRLLSVSLFGADSEPFLPRTECKQNR